ncbi:MAG TPA: Xaa-Pro dipeptidase [Polyangiaceae bacterium]|nr:Xaa-Pro dipeptidase [Polyangiaceae bacterium]
MDAETLDALYVEHVATLERGAGVALESTGWDAVVIHSGSLIKRSEFDDQYWPLRPVPHWQHWLPLAEPDCALVIRPGARPILLRSTAATFWEKPPLPETLVFFDVFDVTGLERLAQVADYLPRQRVAFVGQDAAVATAWGIPHEALRPAALIDALDALRVNKTAYEVACIAEANRRARAGHEMLRRAFRDGDVSELDLHLLYLQATSQDDWETPYKNIIALGANAATLHHVAYGKAVAARGVESLLVDAGATCRGYCADVTRTWVKGKGAAADCFGHLVAAMDDLQLRLCAAARVGVPYEFLHDQSHREVAAALRDVGLVRASVDEAVGTGMTRAFFPHGLGHSLGLQTHDVGCALRKPRADNRYLRNTRDIEPGQIFTIEPGVYFIEELLGPLRSDARSPAIDWNAVDAIAPLGGVRVEDDVLVVSPDVPVRNLTREHLASGGGVA